MPLPVYSLLCLYMYTCVILQTVIAAGLTTDEKTMVFGEKAYRCSFDGCGRLYTTQHHLKVSGYRIHVPCLFVEKINEAILHYLYTV